jgi:hypothetical protein
MQVSKAPDAENQAQIDAYNAATVQRMEPGIQAYWALRSTRRRLKRLKPSVTPKRTRPSACRRAPRRHAVRTAGAASGDSDSPEGDSTGASLCEPPGVGGSL